MMIGGVAYVYPIALPEKRKKLLEWFGLALILGSYVLISKENPWPGYLAIFPVLGTFLIIQAQRNDSLITSNIVFQKLGAWSYSIYLWHWPLVVVIYYFSLNDMFIYFGIALSVLLGFVSNKYIEKIKFRNDFECLFEYFKCKPVYMVLLVGVVGGITFISNGFESHYDLNVIVANDGANNINQRRSECLAGDGDGSRECEYGSGEVDVIVLGDSRAQSLVPIIAKMVPNKTLDWTLSSCRIIEGIFYFKNGYKYDSCGVWLSGAISRIPQNTPVVIHNWLNSIFDNESPNQFIENSFGTDIETYRELMANQYVNTICKIADKNPVILIKDTPVFDSNVPNQMAKNLILGNSEYRVTLTISDYRKQNKITNDIYSEVERRCGVTLIDPEPILCATDYCYGDLDGRPLYFDSHHLNI
jgi:hypothetical protein